MHPDCDQNSTSPVVSARLFHYLTLLASSIYFGDVLTWIVLLYYECYQLQLEWINCHYLWLLILCSIHLLQSPFIHSACDSLPHSTNGSSTQWSLTWCVKSFICTPLYPFIYHPSIYSLMFNTTKHPHANTYTSSPPISIQYYNDHNPYHYVAFWKLFGLNNVFALIRSLFLICLYQNDNINHSIWCLSLFFTLSSVISLFGILSKLISHQTITFLFRWLCFSALYFGYIITLRWISYINSDDTHSVMILSMFKFMFLKIIVLSAPFSIWLGFRKIYLTHIYHKDDHTSTNYSMHLIQCIVSCLFYIFVWECCSFLFYVMGFYPKHYNNISYYTVVFQWISPCVSDPNVVFRIIAFNYYIVSKLTKLNHKQLDSNHDIWILSKYLCKYSTKCNQYYRLVTFEGLRQCLSFSLIDLILWHYSSSSNHHLIINHSTFNILHFWLQQSFFITFIFHLFSLFLTLCIPVLFLLFLSFIYNQSNHAHCTVSTSKQPIMNRIHCTWSEWKLECILTVLFNALICGILILSPYMLRFKYLIAHVFDYGLNLPQSLDQHALFGMMKEVQQYYQQIVRFPARDVILCNIYGKDIASIILQYLPSLHDIFYVE